MTVVEEILNSSALDEHRGWGRDTMTLTWEERRQGHGRRRSDSGIHFALSLPPGTILKEGDCLALPSEETVVQVREAAESVYVIRPANPQEWAFYAYHVGNRHQPVMIGESELIFPEGPAVRSLLEQLGAHYARDSRPFRAAVVASGGAGHSHE